MKMCPRKYFVKCETLFPRKEFYIEMKIHEDKGQDPFLNQLFSARYCY